MRVLFLTLYFLLANAFSDCFQVIQMWMNYRTKNKMNTNLSILILKIKNMHLYYISLFIINIVSLSNPTASIHLPLTFQNKDAILYAWFQLGFIH